MQVQPINPINPIYYNYSYKVQKIDPLEGKSSSCQPLKPLDYSIYNSEIKRVSIYEPLSPKIEERAVDVKPKVPLHPIEKDKINMSEIIYPSDQKQVSFGYKSKLKTLYKKGLLPTVTKGFYGGVLTPDVVTLEHLIPYSKGGPTCLSNLVLATAENNFKRGNKHLFLYFKPDAAREYFEQFVGVRVRNFNGDKYIKSVKKTLSRMGLSV